MEMGGRKFLQAAVRDITALKQAEDNDDLIVRAVETIHAVTHSVIRLPHWKRVIEADFAPGEIKTFRIPRDPAKAVVETNLLEEGC